MLGRLSYNCVCYSVIADVVYYHTRKDNKRVTMGTICNKKKSHNKKRCGKKAAVYEDSRSKHYKNMKLYLRGLVLTDKI